MENSVKLTVVEFEALLSEILSQKTPFVETKYHRRKMFPWALTKAPNPFHIFTQIRQFSCTPETVTSDILHVYWGEIDGLTKMDFSNNWSYSTEHRFDWVRFVKMWLVSRITLWTHGTTIFDKLKTILGEIANWKKAIPVNILSIIGDPTIQHTLICPKSFLSQSLHKTGEGGGVGGRKIYMTPISLIENTI